MKKLACAGRGYTLIELLVGMSIMAIIFSLGLASYRDFSRRQALTGITKSIISDLRMIQQKALSGEKRDSGCTTYLSGYRFDITSSGYDLKALCDVTPIVKQVNLSSQFITISSTADPIDFKVLGQGTNLTTTATITITNTKISKSSIITVGVGGEIK